MLLLVVLCLGIATYTVDPLLMDDLVFNGLSLRITARILNCKGLNIGMSFNMRIKTAGFIDQRSTLKIP